ncbi:MAG: MFS transporter, partial [Granulosicoccus sp.]
MQSSRNALQRNVRFFSHYKAATSVSAWLPIFSLFFLERVSLGDAVLLGSAYYFAVFLLEVPSGYCSDRFGRKPTLIAAAVATALACIAFIAAPSFQILVVAQVLLAASMAFQSGSDSALLYDSLCLLERQDEYSRLESIAQKWSMTALACACLIGGALGMIDLRLPYVVTLVGAL